MALEPESWPLTLWVRHDLTEWTQNVNLMMDTSGDFLLPESFVCTINMIITPAALNDTF